MKWKNETRHGETVGAETRISFLKLSVHHYIGFGNIWFTTCYGVFNKFELGEMQLKQAKDMAMAKLQKKLQEAIDIITEKQ